MIGRSRILLTIMAVAVIAGCGSDRPPLHVAGGVVKFNGEPVADASVMFYPASGRASFAKTDDQGRFSLMTYVPDDGIVAGSYRVTVSKVVSRSKPTEANPYPQAVHALPPVYSNVDTADLQAEVTPNGDNDFVFELAAPSP